MPRFRYIMNIQITELLIKLYKTKELSTQLCRNVVIFSKIQLGKILIKYLGLSLFLPQEKLLLPKV